MTYSLDRDNENYAGPSGYTYAAVAVRPEGIPEGSPDSSQDVLAALREVQFSGWLAAPENGWQVAIAAHGNQTVATGRRGVVGVGEWLAERLAATVVVIRVVDDRQLLLVVWSGGQEIGRYLSDPSHGLGPEDDTLPEPYGVEHAEAFAAACGRSEAAEELAELLAEELDPESVIESERLAGVLRLLALPAWLVAVTSLPRDVPTGPRARDLTQLGAGHEGVAGRVRGRAADVVRRRLHPPPAVTDAPREGEQPDIEPWML